MYRLTVSCDPNSRDAQKAKMQLSWAPAASPPGREISVAVDGKAPVILKIEAGEKEFKGAVGTMGTGAILLGAAVVNTERSKITLPTQTLAVSNLFPNEAVVFPFDTLPQAVRQDLAACFASNNTGY